MTYTHLDAARDLIIILTANYGKKTLDIDNDAKAEATVRIWAEMLKDIHPETIRTSALKWQLTHSWPPTIADIRKIALCPDIPDADSQWEEVTGCFGDPGKFTELPDLTQVTVKKLGGLSFIKTSDSSVRTQFIHCYRESAEKLIEECQKGSLYDDIEHSKLTFSGRDKVTSIEEKRQKLPAVTQKTGNG